MTVYACDRCKRVSSRVFHIMIEIRAGDEDYAPDRSECRMQETDYCFDCYAKIAEVASSKRGDDDGKRD